VDFSQNEMRELKADKEDTQTTRLDGKYKVEGFEYVAEGTKFLLKALNDTGL
jgi:hypothetical protein